MLEPAYHSAFATLQAEIIDGVWTQGDCLPSEAELCARFGISRITISHALQLLDERGLISRQRGRGTFVLGGIPEKTPVRVTDFAASMRAGLRDFRRSVAFAGLCPAPEDMALVLRCRPETPVYHARRVDCDGDLPVACDALWIPREHAEGITPAMLKSPRFFSLWERTLSARHRHTEEVVEVVFADACRAGMLHLPRKTPLLRQMETMVAADAAPLAVFDSYYRADRFRLVSTVPAARPQSARTRKEHS